MRATRSFQTFGRRTFSVPSGGLEIRPRLVALLEQHAYPREQAEKLVDALDSAVCEAYLYIVVSCILNGVLCSINRESWKHMALEEYETVLSKVLIFKLLGPADISRATGGAPEGDAAARPKHSSFPVC